LTAKFHIAVGKLEEKSTSPPNFNGGGLGRPEKPDKKGTN